MKNPLLLGPVKGIKRSGTRGNSKPKSKAGIRKKMGGPMGMADDMFLMNLRMQMSTQGGNKNSIYPQYTVGMPLMTHTYGYNESIEEIRN